MAIDDAATPAESPSPPDGVSVVASAAAVVATVVVVVVVVVVVAADDELDEVSSSSKYAEMPLTLLEYHSKFEFKLVTALAKALEYVV